MPEDEQGDGSTDARLAYRNPLDDRPDSRVREAVAAATVTAIIWIAAIFVLIYFAFTMDYRGTAPSGVMGGYIALACGAALFAMMVFVAIRWHRQPALRHRAIGVWIGAGVACLIEGLCFAGTYWS